MPKKTPPRFAADTLPPEYLTVIGEIVVRWGRLQYQLSTLVAVCFDTSVATGRAFTQRMEVSVLCGLLKTVTANSHWLQDAALRSEICLLGKEVNESRDNRNNFAHALFAFELENPNVFSRYIFKEPEHKFSPVAHEVKIDELQSIATQAQGFVARTADLTHRVQILRDAKA